ncbi:class III extradiol ring-cleavage dioxygenase [Massilia sp. CF038]|uniref:DODA-type extradiol aromatic ring-opening family dioxygenase n=1 Tax=Massilia sp. CF038 TaxID=1881045 RepID=UPI0009142F13|nr:class III extradiol ring-cleavage dioxygenase [Massilia sp. CF038]SHG51898.1 4,5-DOPA dioxygenase extradiol [Massilia sp. CF038]
MQRLPTLFISHGAPTLAIRSTPAHRFLRELGAALPRPKAILIASAHWESLGAPAVSLAEQPETIHDFGGFPQEMYSLRYPAPGAPEVAARAAALLTGAGIPAKQSPNRGLDHGAWVPLLLMYPDADIPVAQISVMRDGTPQQHEQVGRALAGLRDEGVLIIGSGALTHNLAEWRTNDVDALAPDWVRDFEVWMKDKLDGQQRDAVLAYRRLAPSGARNHPSEEHLMPLFVAMGAAGPDSVARRLHSSYEYGILAMDIYAFSDAATNPITT